MKSFIIEKIEVPIAHKAEDVSTSDAFHSSHDLVHRLYEMGLRPGVEVKIINTISFNSVTVIQYGHTRLALNEEEMACLHGR